MKRFIIITLLSSMLTASAVDYKCMSDCLDRGYMYEFCKRICSY